MGFKLDFTKQFEEEARLGPRGYGRKRVVEALAEVEEALKDVSDPAIVGCGPDEPPSLLRELERAADPDHYNDAIARDSDARHALEELAFTIKIAFALGRTAEGAKLSPEEIARLGRKALAQRNAEKSAAVRRKNGHDLRAALAPFIAKHRAVGRRHPDWKSRGDLASIVESGVNAAMGRKVGVTKIAEAIRAIEDGR
jgi:hypothetical protein